MSAPATESVAAPSCYLLQKIPPEIRLAIYEYVLPQQEFRLHVAGPRMYLEAAQPEPESDPAGASEKYSLLYVCKKISVEAVPVMYQKARFVLQVCGSKSVMLRGLPGYSAGRPVVLVAVTQADILPRMKRIEFFKTPIYPEYNETVEGVAKAVNGIITALNTVAQPSAVLFDVCFTGEDKEDEMLEPLIKLFKKVTTATNVLAKPDRTVKRVDESDRKAFGDLVKILQATPVGEDYEV